MCISSDACELVDMLANSSSRALSNAVRLNHAEYIHKETGEKAEAEGRGTWIVKSTSQSAVEPVSVRSDGISTDSVSLRRTRASDAGGSASLTAWASIPSPGAYPLSFAVPRAENQWSHLEMVGDSNRNSEFSSEKIERCIANGEYEPVGSVVTRATPARPVDLFFDSD